MATASSAAIDSRRHAVRILLVATIVTVVLAWQPINTLVQQQSQINKIASAIDTLDRQRAALEEQSRALENPDAIAALARQQYQLVRQNQQLVQVLPNAKAGVSDIDAADPANDPLVSPTNVMSLTPHQSLGKVSGPQGGGYWSRLRHTLEFWR